MLAEESNQHTFTTAGGRQRERPSRTLAEDLERAAKCGVSVRQDLEKASDPVEFNADRCEWAFDVREPHGVHEIAGCLVIRLKDNGQLVLFWEVGGGD